MSNPPARSMAMRNLPNWRYLCSRMLQRLTQDSAELDAARDEALRLATENLALTMQVKRLQARNQEIWDMYVAKGMDK